MIRKKRNDTTIRLSKETKSLLDKLVESKGDSYEDIIKRLIRKEKSKK